MRRRKPRTNLESLLEYLGVLTSHHVALPTQKCWPAANFVNFPSESAGGVRHCYAADSPVGYSLEQVFCDITHEGTATLILRC